MFSMEAETLLAQVVARAHQLPGVGRGSSPVQGRGHCRGVSCGIHLPLLTWFLHFSMVVMRIWFLFIKSRFETI